MSEELETREVSIEQVQASGKGFTGTAIPYGEETLIGGEYRETVAPGAVVSDDGILFWRHTEPIGRYTAKDSESGWVIDATISDTPRGLEAQTLLRDGVVTKLSIGFRPIESRNDNGLVVRTKVHVGEVSLVPHPAYKNANVTQVREDTTLEERDTTMTDSVSAGDLAEVRDSVENLERQLSLINHVPEEALAPQFRSAGEFLKAVVAGDEDAVRAYAGGTTGDLGSAQRNGWTGDLTRLVEGAATVYNLFSKGDLPDEGNFIEYAVLDSSSLAVSGQAAEGDELVHGKVTFSTQTAPVLTRGGYAELSRQAIERGSVPVLNHTLRGLAIELGKDLERVTRAAVNAALTARSGAAVTVADGDLWEDWQSAVIDAAAAFKDEGLALDALVVAKDVFKRLASIGGADGRPVFSINGDGSNTIGTLQVKSLTGQIFSITVVLDAGAANGKAYFANTDAVRIYTDPTVQLSDENITNLTKTFSVYKYIAVAPEIPAGLVPVTITA